MRQTSGPRRRALQNNNNILYSLYGDGRHRTSVRARKGSMITRQLVLLGEKKKDV